MSKEGENNARSCRDKYDAHNCKKFFSRSQITMFVIIAMVLLFIFSFLIFIASSMQKSQWQTAAEEQVKQYLDQNSVNQYVTSCLNIVIDNAAKTTSIQGGTTNFSGMIAQKDYISYFDVLENRTFNISISIMPQYNCSIVSAYAPDYPFPKTDIVPGETLFLVYGGNPATCKYDHDFYLLASGFFGYNNLKRLCNWNGTNKIGATGTQYGYITCNTLTYTSDRRNVTSVQEELELQIEKEIIQCVNFSNLKSSSNITVEGNPKASVTFGNNGMNVLLIYPFKVKMGNRQPITRLVEFGVSKSLPFKELYDYVFVSTYLDVNYADFNPITNLTGNDELATYYKGYDVLRIKDAIPAEHIDIIRYVDNNTLIDGKPLIYQIAAKNRRPALEYMHFVSSIPDIDIFVGENETITLTPQGYDPDEDYLTYEYSGWKEDYDEMYNSSAPGCVGNTVQNVLNFCMQRIPNSNPNNWSNSSLFQITGQNASYTTTPADSGLHRVNITVRESGREGLMDFQEITIYVFTSPNAVANGSSIYGNVAPSFASIEDPYILSGVDSTVGLSGFISTNELSYFEWEDIAFKIREYIVTDDNKTLKIPEETNGTFNMSNIRSFVWAPQHLGEHNVTLTLNTTMGLSDTDVMTVNVTRCLPHRNATNKIYPYNSDPLDVFNSLGADHTCCDNNFNYAGQGFECFENITYGSILNFTDNYFWNKQPARPTGSPIISYVGGNPVNPPSGNLANDIYMRTFERNCSSTSGNTCTGNAAETRTIIASCNDNNYGATLNRQNERCSGPPITGSGPSTRFVSSTTPLQCVNYTFPRTFESIANAFYTTNYPNADGRCNTNKECGWGSTRRAMCNFGCGTGVNAGKCNVSITSECTCNTVTCGAAIQCNNLPYLSTQNIGQCSTSLSYLEDQCYVCGLRDSNICRSSSYHSSCTAAAECNNRAMGSGIDGYQYCTNVCQVASCEPYAFDYDFNFNTCYSSCTSDAQCAVTAGYNCCTQQMIDDGRCAALNACVVLTNTAN